MAQQLILLTEGPTALFARVERGQSSAVAAPDIEQTLLPWLRSRAIGQVEAESSALEGCLLYFVNYGDYK